MIPTGASLAEFFAQHRASQQPLVLATIIATQGSTYRKAGAQMLFARGGKLAGLLSGGCLENDLAVHALGVLESRQPKIVSYDSRTSEDLIWGIGLGCEGAMQILLTRIAPDNDYEPFAYMQRCRETHRAGSVAMVIESQNVQLPVGSAWSNESHGLPPQIAPLLAQVTQAGIDHAYKTAGVSVAAAADAKCLVMPVELPVRLLVLGAGPDAMPLVELAHLMDWHVTVVDHRPAYADHKHFPHAQRVLSQAASELPALLGAQHFDAAIVMSHHLTSDATYLNALADSAIRYIGLLGPTVRRSRLLSGIGTHADKLAARLYGPIGLDIGATTPQTIALAIVSEVQAVLAGRAGASFSALSRSAS